MLTHDGTSTPAVKVRPPDERNPRIYLQSGDDPVSIAIAAAKIGFWEYDVINGALILSDCMAKHFGFTKEDCQGTVKKIYEKIHPDDHLLIQSAYADVITKRIPYHVEYRVTPAPGVIRWMESKAISVFNENGELLRLTGIAQDITDRINFLQEIRQARLSAEKANEAKSVFLANMSHEIRTPLGAILGFTDLLKDKNASENERQHYLNTISRNGQMLTRVIDDILDLSKVEAGRLDFEHSTVNFIQLLNDVLDLFQSRAKSKGIYLQSVIESTVPQRIVSDNARLRQILVNIIGNAIKFTSKGGVRVEVKGEALENGFHKICVFVHDTGPGLTELQMEKIFQPFSQAECSTSRKYGGSGLGLILARRLAQALGGDVVVHQCEPAKGCTFLISIKAKVSEVQIDIKKEPPMITPIPTDDLSGIKVLVVEDSEDNRVLIGQILTKKSALVDIANDGFEGYRQALKGSYDVVLMDIQMPNMDGYSTVRALRDAGYTKPIIALTAHAMDEDRKRAYESGFSAHLPKPLNAKELIETVKYFGRSFNH